MKHVKSYLVVLSLSTLALLVVVIFLLFKHHQNKLCIDDLASQVGREHTSYLCAYNSWNNTLQKMNMDFDVAFFGNSITRNSDFQKYFPKVKIINLGLGGDNLEGMAKRAVQLSYVHPKKIFLMAGINSSKLDTATFHKQYNHLLDSIKYHAPNSILYIQSILPISKTAEDRYCTNQKIIIFNNIIKSICNERHLVFIDIHSLYSKNGELPLQMTRYSKELRSLDGIHVKDESYLLWSNAIKKYIQY